MRAFPTVLAAIFLAASSALAQTPGIGETRPAPDRKTGAPDAQKPEPGAERALKRCSEIAGTVREDCLREERDATGAAVNEAATGGTRRPEPPTAPPPQNPR
ncbi:MAG TPA: hypothetical protein VM183_00345 [Burkholderiales bacterium]|nr:hypothetical protein [Burkholderiales bacterium]